MHHGRHGRTTILHYYIIVSRPSDKSNTTTKPKARTEEINFKIFFPSNSYHFNDLRTNQQRLTTKHQKNACKFGKLLYLCQ